MDQQPLLKDYTQWWKLFLSMFPRNSDENSARIPHPTAAAYAFPLVILVASIFLSEFLIFSNEDYLDHIVDNAMTRATTREQQETLELNREANKQILRNPGIRVLMASGIVMRFILSLIASFVLFWLSLAGVSGRWESFPEFWRVALSSTSVLVIGVGVLLFLRWFFYLADNNLSLVLLLHKPDFDGVLFSLLSNLDLFNAWFLFLLSSRLSSIYHESTATLFVIFLVILIIEILFSSLVHASFFLVS
jgi:hypothetical protein